MDARTRQIGLAVLALVLALALPAAGADAAGLLKKGSRGARVGSVQKALGLSSDRIFGKQTKRAVKRFQRSRGMTVDGIVGPATWELIKQIRLQQRSSHAAANPSPAGGGSPRVASRGSSVVRLQQALGILADGVFGPGTAGAVETFQRAHGLTADGIVGPATWAALGVSGIQTVLKRAHLGGSGGGLPSAVARVIAAASRIAHKPYKYGGGHGQWEDSGYDCSGSVSYALHGGGLLGSPLDSSALMSYGVSGKGRYITIYANPGHAYMVVNGRRFDTTGRSETGSRWQWRTRSSSGYTVRHPVGL